MRLTLRTMLAYMDSILEPDDAQLISKKIEESQVASGLMHRIREVMRRLRLGAPGIADHGDGLDPNTVAEYLDNTLSDARVPDFEKVCFESDVHLAEVASCHQILTLVLGEPAEISPDSRLRMYQVPDLLAVQAKSRVTAQEREVSASAGDGAGRTAEPPEGKSRSHVPDFLIQATRPRRRLRHLVAVALLVLLLIGIAIVWGHPYWGSRVHLFQEAPIVAEGNGTEKMGDQGTSGESQKSATSPTEPSQREEKNEKSAPSSEKTADHPVKKVESSGEPAPKDVLPSATMKTSSASGERTMSPSSPAKETASKQSPKDSAETAVPLEQPPGVIDSTTPRGPNEGTATGKRIPRAPARMERVGTVLPSSPSQVLLKLDPPSGSWRRLADGAFINSTDQLLSLPAFRPVISLVSKIRLQWIDGTSAGFQSVGPAGVPTLIIDYGRMVMRAEDAAVQSRLRLQIGEQAGTLTFMDPQSEVAIEAGRFGDAGGDPETQPAPLSADLYITAGQFVWQEEPDKKPIKLNAPIRYSINERPVDAVEMKTAPRWIHTSSLSALEQRAIPPLERSLEVKRPLNLSLHELAEDRRKEVRMLAMRYLAVVGDYELLVKALGDPDQRFLWTAEQHIEQLRSSILTSPQAAAQVRTTMEKMYGEQQGSNMYELLWKYHGEEIAPSDAHQLVQYLDHEVLAFRALSIWNLRNITGSSLNYQIGDTASHRQAAIQHWKAWEKNLKASPTLRSKEPSEKDKPSHNTPKKAPPPPAEEKPRPLGPDSFDDGG